MNINIHVDSYKMLQEKGRYIMYEIFFVNFWVKILCPFFVR